MRLDKLDAPTLFSLAKALFPLERTVDKSFLIRLTDETSKRLRNLPGDEIASCALALPSPSRPMNAAAQRLWVVTLRDAVAALGTMTPAGLVSLLYSFSKLHVTSDLPTVSRDTITRVSIGHASSVNTSDGLHALSQYNMIKRTQSLCTVLRLVGLLHLHSFEHGSTEASPGLLLDVHLTSADL
jgi:hypothetical protein